jgi:hypothetical protein
MYPVADELGPPDRPLIAARARLADRQRRANHARPIHPEHEVRDRARKWRKVGLAPKTKLSLAQVQAQVADLLADLYRDLKQDQAPSDRKFYTTAYGILVDKLTILASRPAVPAAPAGDERAALLTLGQKLLTTLDVEPDPTTPETAPTAQTA